MFRSISRSQIDTARSELTEILKQLGYERNIWREMPKHWGGPHSLAVATGRRQDLGTMYYLLNQAKDSAIQSAATEAEKIIFKRTVAQACHFLLLPNHSQHLLDGLAYIKDCLEAYKQHHETVLTCFADKLGLYGEEEQTSGCFGRLFSCLRRDPESIPLMSDLSTVGAAGMTNIQAGPTT